MSDGLLQSHWFDGNELPDQLVDIVARNEITVMMRVIPNLMLNQMLLDYLLTVMVTEQKLLVLEN